MRFGTIITNDCENVVPPPDPRCSDPAFALANPDVCPIQPQLLIKPGFGLVCLLGSIQLGAFYVQNGTEQDVTGDAVFTSSDIDVLVVGATSGNGTGVGAGTVTVTATYQGLTATTTLTILPDTDCCDEQVVATMVMVDNSKSMSLAFGSSYISLLDFAKAAAVRYISETNTDKDLIGLMSFNAFAATILSDPISNKTTVGAQVSTITQTQQSTEFFDALTTAIASVNSVSSDRKVIVIISDGLDQSPSYGASDNPLQLASEFKSQGGVVIVLGTRASGRGYAFLNAIATGGFFINGYNAVVEESLDYLSGLKGYLCSGQCKPAGDEYQATGQLDYSGFANWNVSSGHVDLIGNGLIDLLPGNGLYVDLAGSSSPHKGTLTSKNAFSLDGGKQYRIALHLAGNQRVNATPNTVSVKVFDPNGGSPIYYLNQTITINDFAQEFQPYSFTFTPASDVDVYISFEQTDTPAGFNSVGVLLDRVKFDNVTDAITLLNDDFDTENLTYVPPACGAGDVYAPIGGSNPYFEYLTFLNERRYYDVVRGPVHFFILDSDPREPDGTAFNSIQGQWLQAGLAASTSPWNVVICHHAPYSSDDTHGSTAYMQWPFADWGADAVISGHAHDYERLSVDDIPYFVIGIGGNSLRGFDVPLAESVVRYNSDFGAMRISAEDTYLKFYLKFEMISRAGAAIDNFTIGTVPGSPDPTVYAVIADQGGDTTDQADVANLIDGWNVSYLFTAGDNVYQPDPVKTIDEQIGKHYRQFIYPYLGNFGDGATENRFFPALGNHDWDFIEQEGTLPSYGYTYGYNCESEGCLTNPPAAQLPDPSPLADIEAGYTPPKIYTSTKQACATCPEGFEHRSGDDLVPQMTSNTDPSGVASASSTYLANGGMQLQAFRAFDHASSTFWEANSPTDVSTPFLQYKFAASTTVAGYAITAFGTGSVTPDFIYRGISVPKSWEFQGSNDGITWTTIDTQTDITFFMTEEKLFVLDAAASYQYFRLLITADTPHGQQTVGRPPFVTVGGLTMYGPTENGEVCRSATAESTVSQSDADSKATASALALATAGLNCVQLFTSTQQYTASCPVGTFGQAVTKSATRTSYVAQEEADAAALAVAQEEAEAELDCTGSNNNQPITINDAHGGASAASTPYPSVKHVSGLSGLVTKVVVTLKNFSHQYPDDVCIFLRSPTGETCELMRRCGGSNSVSNLTFVFDDAAGSSLPDSTALSSGTFKPTQFPPNAPVFPAPAPAGPYGSTLAAFNGIDPNGSWSLWIQDTTFLHNGSIAGPPAFDLTITTA